MKCQGKSSQKLSGGGGHDDARGLEKRPASGGIVW